MIESKIIEENLSDDWDLCENEPSSELAQQPQKDLIIGCGHGKTCRYLHPADNFITVDISADIKADVVCNVNKCTSIK